MIAAGALKLESGSHVTLELFSSSYREKRPQAADVLMINEAGRAQRSD
jgi:hypothetical protein